MSDKNGNGVLKRVGENFAKEIKEIQKAREKKGIHKRHNSIRYLTELLVRHDDYEHIKQSMINFQEKIQ
ncbi:hypothetical protein LCGC14_1095340 [marine sediment metagenome]|uniref:Uncharacterized protein n=1 Tax=marine sediment metagenome TaxID=412755 RepID=A0A0F9QH52_9ZZZZ